MKVPLEHLLAQVEMRGGAVAPPDVLALTKTIYAYAGLVGELAGIIGGACRMAYPSPHLLPVALENRLNNLSARMESVRVVELPDGSR